MLPSEQVRDKSRGAVRRVPGEVPEPPNFRTLAEIDTLSLSASSVTSLGSILNLVQNRQTGASATTTTCSSKNLGPSVIPEKSTFTSQSSSSKFLEPSTTSIQHKQLNSLTRLPHTTPTAAEPARTPACPTRVPQTSAAEARGEEIQNAYKQRKCYNQEQEVLNAARAVQNHTAYAREKDERRYQWQEWQSSSTLNFLQQQALRDDTKSREECQRRGEFQEMIQRQIDKDRGTHQPQRLQGYGPMWRRVQDESRFPLQRAVFTPYPQHPQSEEILRECVNERATRSEERTGQVQPVPVCDSSAYFVGQSADTVRGALKNRRKQSLIHRLVPRVTCHQPVTQYQQVVQVNNVIPDVLANNANPESLFFVNGEVLDLSCFHEGKELSPRAIDSYLTILEVKRSEALENKRVKIWSANSVFCSPEVNINIFQDGTVRESTDNAFTVDEDFLLAVDNAEEMLVGLVATGAATKAYVIDKKHKKINVQETEATSIQSCFSKIRTSIEQRRKENGWQVKYLNARLLPFTESTEASTHAMYAIETFISGTSKLPGVDSLLDYKQKMKWSVIGESDSCFKAMKEAKTKVKQEIADCYKQMLAKVEASRTLAELLETLPFLEPVANKLFCQRCITTKNFKPLTVPVQGDAKQFHNLKGNIVKHLQSDKHKRNCGIQLEVSEDHPESNYRKAKTYEQLEALYPWLTRSSDNAVTCAPCAVSFQFPEESASDYVQKFTQVKSRVRSHSSLQAHRLKIEEKTSEQDHAVGKNLGLNAYLCIKDSLGLVEYERQINNDVAKDVPVGEFNHSKGFVAEMRKNFAEVLRQKFVQQTTRTLESTGKKTKISLVADKCSLYSKSYHVVGCVAHINGKYHSYVMEVMESSGDDGESMAKDIYSCLTKFYSPEEIKRLIVAACMDGQYFHNKVPEKLLDLMGVPLEHRVAYTFQWDASHVVEVICKHARGQKEGLNSISVNWIRTTLSTISSLSVDYRQPAALRDLQRFAAQLENEDEENTPNLRRLQTYSKTRFASHLSKFINVLDHDYPILYQHLKHLGDNSFNSIATPEFVLRMTALADVYKIIGDVSKKLQVVHKLPWHSAEAIDELRMQLNKVVEACSANVFKETVDVLPKFSSCVSGILLWHTYKGMELNMVPQKRTRRECMAESGGPSDVVTREAAAVAAHAKALIENLDAKYFTKPGKGRKTVPELCGAGTLNLISECFSFNKIRENGAQSEKLLQLYNVYVSAGLLDSQITFNDLDQQYQSFLQHTLEAYPVNTDVKTETDYYIGKLEGPDVSQSALMEVLSLSINRNCVETVVETMTSQIASVMEGRSNLAPSNLSDEMVIRHNGPPGGPKAEKLVVEALNLKFNGKPWKFHRTSGGKNALKTYDGGSKVLERLQKGDEKIVF